MPRGDSRTFIKWHKHEILPIILFRRKADGLQNSILISKDVHSAYRRINRRDNSNSMKISINTYYDLEDDDGTTTRYKASVYSDNKDVSLEQVLEMNQEKIGAIERKISKQWTTSQQN